MNSIPNPFLIKNIKNSNYKIKRVFAMEGELPDNAKENIDEIVENL
jgi:hypothetical protein